MLMGVRRRSGCICCRARSPGWSHSQPVRPQARLLHSLIHQTFVRAGTPCYAATCNKPRAAQFLGQHGQRLARAVLFLQPSEVFLACRIVPQKQDGGFRKGPFQARVTNLASRGAVAFTGGFFCTFDQAAIGDKILHPPETLDVMNLVEQDEAQDFPIPGTVWSKYRVWASCCLAALTICSSSIAQQVIVSSPNQGEIHFHALLDCWIGEPLGDAIAVGFVGQLFANLGQVVLAIGVLDVRQEFRPFA